MGFAGRLAFTRARSALVSSCAGLLCVFLFAPKLSASSLSTPAESPPSNWSGDYAPCDRHRDLLNQGHVDLGVRLSSANSALNRQFARAMEFWSNIVDLDWHEVTSQQCAIQLVDGTRSLFETSGVAARSQFPDRALFEGWIAFNPSSKLTEHEMFVISVHEIGHLLGLQHNPDESSVMFFLDLGESVCLDAVDLRALAARHQLRTGVASSGPAVAPRVALH